MRVFIGWDPREEQAYQVAKTSIWRRATRDVGVVPLILKDLNHILTRPVEKRNGQLWCPISEAPMSTEFAISRFMVPFLQREGWALFMDCDVLCLSDITKLMDQADTRYAVQVVKHANYQPAEKLKMDGQVQTAYSRKNWSSVVLWNCGHPAHVRLTREALNTWPGRDLHAFKWLLDEEIGELPRGWNYLVGVSPTMPMGNIHIAHYTLGTPDMPGMEWGELSHQWWKELEYANERRAS